MLDITLHELQCLDAVVAEGSFQRAAARLHRTHPSVHAAVKNLEARGVAFSDYTEGPLVTTNHIAQVGPARGAWFHDPDGNTLGLRQA